MSLHGLVAQHLHAGVRDGVAKLVEDASGDRGALRQREVGAFHQLAVGDLDRRAGFEGPLLAVAKRHESGLRGGEGPAARGKILELEAAVGIGVDEAIGPKLAGLGADLRTAHGHPVVGRDDAPADDCGARRLVARRVATGLVARRQLSAAAATALAEGAPLGAAARASLARLRDERGRGCGEGKRKKRRHQPGRSVFHGEIMTRGTSRKL